MIFIFLRDISKIYFKEDFMNHELLKLFQAVCGYSGVGYFLKALPCYMFYMGGEFAKFSILPPQKSKVLK